jgi:serine/threonine protein kinase
MQQHFLCSFPLLGACAPFPPLSTPSPFPGSPLQSLLRCRWPAGRAYHLLFVLRVAHSVAGALEQMHYRGVCHGDVYAHNVLADEEGHAVLCDYGEAVVCERLWLCVKERVVCVWRCSLECICMLLNTQCSHTIPSHLPTHPPIYHRPTPWQAPASPTTRAAQ